MSNLPNFPTIRPALLLDFANSKSVDPRITSTRASIATRTNEKGLVETVAANVPRLDFDPTTGECKGLLIEEARTNLLTYSEQFDNAAWTKTGATIATNVIAAPDGTLTADKLVEDTSTGAHRLRVGAFGLANNTVRCLSVSAKASERNSVSLTINAFSGNYIEATFNLLTGAVTSSAYGKGALASARAENVGGDYWRLSLAGAPDTTSSTASCDHYIQATGSYTGDGTSGFFIWGAQIEVGSFPTSYIPTTSAAATRAADVASMSGTNFSEWYRQDEGTFVVSSSPYSSPETLVDRRIFTASDGTTNNRVGALYSSTGFNATVVSSGGVSQYGPADAAISSTPAVRALAYKAGDIRAALNGSLSAASAGSAVVPVGVNNLQLGTMNASGHLNGYIARLFYYPKRLTNAELQALTA